MTTMLEKMCRAMCVADGHDPDVTCDIYVPGDPDAGKTWAGYRNLARAALQAIRAQPPEIGYFQTIADAHRVSPQRAWADMIDAILGEKA